ncbi:MAG TPA: hypothetical protein VG755_30495 [Nannocystaceae bacterium]|nr:hypothetical protein [Nannocystaceae bacterium]
MRGSCLRWALSSTIAASISTAIASVHAAEPPTASSEPSQIEIDAAIGRAKAAAMKRDYATALAEFEKARAMKATAQLHFNVAVCHQALMLAAAEGTPERDAQRQAAIAAYREYLAAAPEASDRADVERIVIELGGTTGPEPAPEPEQSPALPELREIVTRIDPEEPAPKPEPKPVVPDRPPTPVSKVHGRVGPFVPVVLAHMGRLGGRTLVSPLIGLGVRGGVFLGARERLNLGGELAAYGMPAAPSAKHVLVGAMFGATLEYGDTVGKKKRFAIAGGIVIGPAFESLRYHGNAASKATCSVDKKDEVSSRAGAVLAPRLALMVLLGKRRNHEIGLRITPALALFGNGTSQPPGTATSCDQTPFAEVGLPGGAALVTTIDLGYAPRL